MLSAIATTFPDSNPRKYSAWKLLQFNLKEDGNFVFYDGSALLVLEITPLELINCTLEAIPSDFQSGFICLEITNRHYILNKKDHFVIPEVSFRFILSVDDAKAFSSALKRVYPAIEQHIMNDDRMSSAGSVIRMRNDSNMLSREADTYFNRLQKNLTHSKRRAFRFLPAFARNDLVFGSWWFVLGSTIAVLLCVVVLVNNYYDYLGTDDSALPPLDYRIAWGMALASSVFFTVGSLAFVRACNEPPLPPLFGLSCGNSDESFGLWFFIMSVFPAIPYCFVYLAVKRSELYFICMIIAIAIIIAGVVFMKCIYRPRKVVYHYQDL